VLHLVKAGGYSLANAWDIVETKLSETSFLDKQTSLERWNRVKILARQNVLKWEIPLGLVAGYGGNTVLQDIFPKEQKTTSNSSTPAKDTPTTITYEEVQEFSTREKIHTFGDRVALNIKLQTLNEKNSK
jgi:hypothetical protein